MLTPGFELNQNEEFLIITILVPYAKISDVDIHFEDQDFIFFIKPYYLRLNLPGKVRYCENPAVQYDVDKSTFTVKVPKANPGEHFEGLDLQTKLLPPKKKIISPLIEVVGESAMNDNADNDDDYDFDWSIEQVPIAENIHEFSIIGQQCGFANSYSFTVFKLKEETTEIFDVVEPDAKSPSQRCKERQKTEFEQFAEDHYVGDLYHDEEIQQLLKYHPVWDKLYDELEESSVSVDEKVQFTAEEKAKLQKLPNKEYVLDKSQVKMSLLGLIDIMFAYAYDKRTCEGESTVESAWTINKLSATLCWLETFASVYDVASTCVRRSLCYPLFRHFELAMTVLEDVRKIFCLGRKYILKCLLEIHDMFSESEPRYILNDLYITDYCIWIQTKTCSTAKLLPLAKALGKVLLTKGDIGLNLVDIESFAAVAWMSHHSIPNNPRHAKHPGTKTMLEENDEQNEAAESLHSEMENLNLQKSPNTTPSYVKSILDSCPDFETCSSCTSDSSNSSSNTFESDSSSLESHTDYTSDEDSSENSSESSDSEDSIEHCCLLRKENSEKFR